MAMANGKNIPLNTLYMPYAMNYKPFATPQLTFLYTQKVDYCMIVDVIFNIIHRLKA